MIDSPSARDADALASRHPADNHIQAPSTGALDAAAATPAASEARFALLTPPDHPATGHASAGPVEAPAAAMQESSSRGAVVSLLVIPLGAIVWVILWNMGFNAPYVGFGIAAGAMALFAAKRNNRTPAPRSRPSRR